MKKGYIAGALFKEADVKQRIYEGEKIKKAVGDKIDFFNPITDNPSNDKSTLPTAESIFKNDTQKIIDSNYIFAELDGEDAGVMAELGIAWGINFMRETIKQIIKYKLSFSDSEKDFEILMELLKSLLEVVPEKEIIAHLTDIRVETAGKYNGIYVPYGYNQYVIGMIEGMGGIICNSVDNAIKEIEKKVEE